MVKAIILLFVASILLAQTPSAETTTTVPVTTQWLHDAVAPGAKGTINSVVRVFCPKSHNVGSGFLLDSGYVITNYHVIDGCAASDIEVVNSLATVIPIGDLWFDEHRDLAALKSGGQVQGTFKIDPTKATMVGTQLSAWGYPFSHPGPAPLLTVGYLSGFADFRDPQKKKAPVKRLVVNGAFNPGNSGGPLISPEGTIIGVVVAKRTMALPPALVSALKVLAENPSGLQFTATQDGKSWSVSESQVTAMLLDYYHKVSQVFIGEAVAASELVAFLNEKKIPWNQPSKKAEADSPTVSAEK